jgi:hypothetical protein
LLFIKRTLEREKLQAALAPGSPPIPPVVVPPDWGGLISGYDSIVKARGMELCLGILYLTTSAGTLIYWLDFFFGGSTRVSDEQWYNVFERSFPIADAWMSICALVGGIGLLRKKQFGPRICLLASGALVFLALMDITFNIENNLYPLAAHSFQMVIEIFVNSWTLGFGVMSLLMIWRRL